MATAGPNFAGTGADDSSVGTVSWASPGNITAEDAAVAGATFSVNNSLTHYLKATNFGFAIPAGATIVGILAEIKRQRNNNNTNSVFENSVKLLQGGTVGGTDQSAGTIFPPNTTGLTYKSYGSASDLWGRTWASSDINASNFGLVLQAKGATSGDGSYIGQVDSIRITITYTPANTRSPSGGAAYSSPMFY